MQLDNMLEKAVRSLIELGAHTATAYLSPTLTIRVTRRLVRGKVPTDHRRYDLVLTIGRPNARAKAFIKAAVQANEPFPIKKIQFSFPRTQRPVTRCA